MNDITEIMKSFIPNASYTAAELWLLVEKAQPELFEAADALIAGGYAHFRLEADYQPDGPVLRLWAVPRADIDGDPVELAIVGEGRLLKPMQPSPEKAERLAWLFRALKPMPPKH